MLASVLQFALGSPVGRALGLLLALVVWTTYHRLDAASEARQSCEDAQLVATVEERERQLAVAEKIAQDARDRADQAEAEMRDLREAADAIIEQAGDTCDIPDGVRQRLRDIR